MEPDLRKELRQHAWAYFDRHAEQRLKTFNFYILLCTALVAGIVALSREPNGFETAWVFGFLGASVSFVFWKLDVRNRELVKHSEEALKRLENELDLPNEDDGSPNRCKLFLHEAAESSRRLDAGESLLAKRFSYTNCFNWLFCLFGFGGLLVTLLSLGSLLCGSGE